MPPMEDRRYAIAEVSEIVGVPPHVLREWEKRIGSFAPKRDRTNQRYYSPRDIEIAQRIKQLVRNEGMTTEGAAKQLRRELAGEGKPRTNRDALELLDAIEADIRAMLDRLDAFDNPKPR